MEITMKRAKYLIAFIASAALALCLVQNCAMAEESVSQNDAIGATVVDDDSKLDEKKSSKCSYIDSTYKKYKRYMTKSQKSNVSYYKKNIKNAADEETVDKYYSKYKNVLSSAKYRKSHNKLSQGKVYQILRQEGLSRSGACAVMANIKRESGFSPRAGSVSYGLFQWLGGRKSAMKNYCYKHGLKYYSTWGQLQFFLHEVKTGYSGTYKSLKHGSLYTCVRKMVVQYERPASQSYEVSLRYKYAKAFYRKYK